MKTADSPLFSQRLELGRVVAWLRSERFKCDESRVTMRQAGIDIADLIESGAYLADTACTRGSDPPMRVQPLAPATSGEEKKESNG